MADDLDEMTLEELDGLGCDALAMTEQQLRIQHQLYRRAAQRQRGRLVNNFKHTLCYRPPRKADD